MKSVYTKEYKLLCNWLVVKRRKAKLTQTELAELLGKPQSYVSKYENGDRRLDIFELLEVSVLLKADPSAIIKELFDIISKARN